MSYLLKNSSQVVAALEHTSHIIKSEINVRFKQKDYGISYRQWVILDAIANKDGQTQIQIAKTCNKEPASISRTLQYLSNKGLVIKKSDSNNKKVKKISLTSSGEALTEEATLSVEEVSKNCLDNIYERELNIFIKILDRIRERKAST